MKWRIVDLQGETLREGEGGKLVSDLEAGLPDHENLILEWTPPQQFEVTVPMQLRPLDRLDAEMVADLFGVDVEHLPLER